MRAVILLFLTCASLLVTAAPAPKHAKLNVRALERRSQISDLLSSILSAGNGNSNCTDVCSPFGSDVSACGGSDSCLCNVALQVEAQSCASCADSFGANVGGSYGDYIRACDDLDSTTTTTTSSTTSSTLTSTTSSHTTSSLTSSRLVTTVTQTTTQGGIIPPAGQTTNAPTQVPILSTQTTSATGPAVVAWVPTAANFDGEVFGLAGTTGGSQTTLFARETVTLSDSTITVTDVLVLAPTAFVEAFYSGVIQAEVACSPGTDLLGGGECHIQEYQGTALIFDTTQVLVGGPKSLTFQLPSEPTSLPLTIGPPLPTPSA